jgi:hypothetical protein
VTTSPASGQGQSRPLAGAGQVSALAAQLEAAATDEWSSLSATAEALEEAIARVMASLAAAGAGG